MKDVEEVERDEYFGLSAGDFLDEEVGQILTGEVFN